MKQNSALSNGFGLSFACGSQSAGAIRARSSKIIFFFFWMVGGSRHASRPQRGGQSYLEGLQIFIGVVLVVFLPKERMPRFKVHPHKKIENYQQLQAQNRIGSVRGRSSAQTRPLHGVAGRETKSTDEKCMPSSASAMLEDLARCCGFGGKRLRWICPRLCWILRTAPFVFFQLIPTPARAVASAYFFPSGFADQVSKIFCRKPSVPLNSCSFARTPIYTSPEVFKVCESRHNKKQ